MERREIYNRMTAVFKKRKASISRKTTSERILPPDSECLVTVNLFGVWFSDCYYC